jgi:predicted HAD superfamily Cof-like phosphohydrolase
MNKSLQMVKEFHDMFEHPIGKNSSHKEPLEIRQLRIKLLFEELSELVEASDCKATFIELLIETIYNMSIENDPNLKGLINYTNDIKDILNLTDIKDGDNVDKIEELDALCDIQYVLNGKILTAGLQNIFDREYQVVHENNMTKAHDTEEEALKTLNKVLNNKGVVFKRNGKYLVNNTSGKLIKPYNHEKVNLNILE